MPLETVRLDRVFGVAQTSQNREQVTLSGFESGNRKEYSVAAPGKPRIESGMTITAYLAEAGNWQTLIDWRDHENGAILCKPAGRPIFLCVWSVLGFCMAARGVWDRSIMLSAIAVFFCCIRLERREFSLSAESPPRTGGVGDARRYSTQLLGKS